MLEHKFGIESTAIIVQFNPDQPFLLVNPGQQTGTEGDILYAVRTGNTWSAGQPIDSYAFTDAGSDIGPVAMTTTEDGAIIAAWSTNEPFTSLGRP